MDIVMPFAFSNDNQGAARRVLSVVTNKENNIPKLLKLCFSVVDSHCIASLPIFPATPSAMANHFSSPMNSATFQTLPFHTNKTRLRLPFLYR